MTNCFFHATAVIETEHIGDGTRIWAFAHVLPDTKIGANCNICDHTYVESGVIIGNNVTLKNHVCVWEGITLQDDVFVGPYVSFTNDLYPRSPRMSEVRDRYRNKDNWLVRTVIEQGSTIGANATIVAGVCVGRYSFIAAGATVTRDVEPFAMMMGSPARKTGYVCRCGKPIESPSPSSACTHNDKHPTLSKTF